MTRQDQSNEPMRGTMVFLALAVALALGVMAAIPASGLAATKFGADLSSHPEPDWGNEWCPGGAAMLEFHVPCTRVPQHYGDIGYAQNPTAPEDGVVDRIRLIASVDGEFRPQLVKMKWEGLADTEIKVKDTGPWLEVEGGGETESFDVDMPV